MGWNIHYITQKISSVAYELELPTDWKIWNIFHVSLLEPYRESTTYQDRQWFRPPPVEGSKDKYLVERLLDKRVVTVNGRHRTEYLMQWQGYPIYEATWEPVSNLTGKVVKDMKRRFNASHS